MAQELQLPNGFRPLDNQVAGHSFTDPTPALGMLMCVENSNCVLKPLGKPECGKREHKFYESVQTIKEPLINLIPRFYGKVKLIVNQQEHVFLKLENLTHGMQKPCIMDIKIGRRTWDPLATPEKRSVEEEKYIKCKKPLGLCLPGFQMYTHCAENEWKLARYGKDYGKKLDDCGFRETMALFLNSRQTVCRVLVEAILKQLYAIRSWFNQQTIYHFYASSILLAYDAACLVSPCMPAVHKRHEIASNGNTTTTCENGMTTSTTPTTQCSIASQNWVQVRMIDFAHVFPSECGSLDTNYLFGLRNLILILENLLKR